MTKQGKETFLAIRGEGDLIGEEAAILGRSPGPTATDNADRRLARLLWDLEHHGSRDFHHGKGGGGGTSPAYPR